MQSITILHPTMQFADQNQDVIREEKGIQALVEVLRQGGHQAMQETAGAFLNLATNNKQNQDVIREEGGIQPLMKVLRTGTQEAQQEAAKNWQSVADKLL